jgi:hypothetical protein
MSAAASRERDRGAQGTRRERARKKFEDLEPRLESPMIRAQQFSRGYFLPFFECLPGFLLCLIA